MGAETVQFYIHYVQSPIDRLNKGLKDFKNVFLQPDEKRNVSIAIDNSTLGFYEETSNIWQFKNGQFEALIGNSYNNISLSQPFILQLMVLTDRFLSISSRN